MIRYRQGHLHSHSIIVAIAAIFAWLTVRTTLICAQSVTSSAAVTLRKGAYEVPFGSGKWFLPSNVETVSGDLIPAKEFPRAAYCRHCHESTYHQWRESLHANSFREPFYLKNVQLLIGSKGKAYSRHCEGCHNPIALLSGALTDHPVSRDRRFDEDGITCSVCHSITQLQPSYGLGSYVMGTPAVIVDERGKPVPGEVPYRMILDHPDRHMAAVMKPFYRTPEFCAACHKANLPRTLNGYKWLRAFDTWDEWQRSAFSKRSPLPYYSRSYADCQTCHMPRLPIHGSDYAAKEGMLASHRWLGGNTAVPFFYGYADQLHQTEVFLKDNRIHVDIFAVRKAEVGGDGGPWVAPLGSAAFILAPGDVVDVAVVIQNRGIGHSLVPEQRDIFEAWVDFAATDSSGRVISESGKVNADGSLDSRAHGFVTRLLNRDGSLLVKHEVWLRHTVATDATIPSGQSVVVCYRFAIPHSISGSVKISAEVLYRHLNEAFTRFALGENHPAYPIVAMASDSRTLAIGHNDPAPLEPEGDPDWLRWNNFGIAMLNAQQYSDAAAAFQHVTGLRPDAPDGDLNSGVANLAAQQFSLAATFFGRALDIAPNDPRALFYRGIARRAQGNLKGAATDLSGVAALYPDSMDTNRELGLTDYLLGKSAEASSEFQRVEQNDPDDLLSHYYLSLLYRREGENNRAGTESARFVDEKPDPQDDTDALQFLSKHPDIAGERHPWHMHVLSEESNRSLKPESNSSSSRKQPQHQTANSFKEKPSGE